MRHTWTLTKSRMQLALRNRAFMFFSLIMPVAFLFVYLGIFSGGSVAARAFLMGPVLALTIMGGFFGLSMQLVWFREQGILRRFRLAPLGPAAMLASSIMSNAVLMLPTVVLELVLARFIFGVHQFGNLLSLLIVVVVGTVTFSSFGLVVASITNTMQETQVMINAIWFPFLFLSGATIPLAMMPPWVQKVSFLLPATYLVMALQRALVGGFTVLRISEELAVMVVGAAAAFTLSVQLFRWEPEEKVTRRAKLLALTAAVPFLLLGIWEARTGHLQRGAQSLYQQVRQSPQPDTRTSPQP